jgi:hypothetical protein
MSDLFDVLFDIFDVSDPEVEKQRQRLEIEACREVYAGIAAASQLCAGLTEQQTPMIEGDHRGVACRVAIALDGGGFVYTYASAMPSEVHTIRLAVSPRGRLSAHHVTVGDAAFDAAFLIKATPIECAPELLSAPIRETLTAMVARGLMSFTVEPQRVLLRWSGVERSADVILAALDLVATAARFRDAQRQAYR